MKLLIISPKAPPIGGIARWTEIIVNRIKQSHSITLYHVNSSPYCSCDINDVTRRMVVGLKRLPRILNEEKEILEKEEIDVVHICSSGSLGLIRDYLILKKAKEHQITTVLHLHYGRIPEAVKKNTVEWRALQQCFRYTDKVMAIDKATFEVISRQCSRVEAYYCPNPVKSDVYEKLVVPYEKRENKICFIGHIIPEKGIDELLYAWEQLVSKEDSLVLEMIGKCCSGSYASNLQNVSGVRYKGELPHQKTMAELATAKLLVLPSYTEGFPNVILEAMALKVPVVATNVGAIPDMISNGCGVVIEPRSSEAIVSAVEMLIDNPAKAEQISERSYEKVQREYAAEAVIEQYIRIWRGENT